MWTMCGVYIATGPLPQEVRVFSLRSESSEDIQAGDNKGTETPVSSLNIARTSVWRELDFFHIVSKGNWDQKTKLRGRQFSAKCEGDLSNNEGCSKTGTVSWGGGPPCTEAFLQRCLPTFLAAWKFRGTWDSSSFKAGFVESIP